MDFKNQKEVNIFSKLNSRVINKILINYGGKHEDI